jgi:hypothetical protein
MNIGGSGKNAVGADFIEFTNGIDLLTREYERWIALRALPPSGSGRLGDRASRVSI